MGKPSFLLLVAVLSQRPTHFLQAPREGCATLLTHADSAEEDSFQKSLLIQISVSPIWKRLGFTSSDASTMQVIHDDGLCAKAKALIDSTVTERARPFGIRLAHLANRYVAMETKGPDHHSEFQTLYVLDEQLKRMVYPCPGGKICK